MASQQSVRNKNSDELPGSGSFNSWFAFAQQSCGMSVHGMYGVNDDNDIGLTRMADHTLLQYDNVFRP